MTNKQKKEEAMRLYTRGYYIWEIAKILEVSESVVVLWLRL